MTIGQIPQAHRIYLCSTSLGSIPSIVFFPQGKLSMAKIVDNIVSSEMAMNNHFVISGVSNVNSDKIK